MGEKDDSFFVSIWPLAKEAHAGESLGWEGMPEGQENRWKGEMDDMQKVLDMEKLIAVAVSIIEEEQGVKIEYTMERKEEYKEEASA